MTNQIAESTLMAIVANGGLEQEYQLRLLDKFRDYDAVASEWDLKAKQIKVTDISQTDLMKQAREGRLFLKKKRGEIEAKRKELKEGILKEGRVIDGISNYLKSKIEPIESYLEAQENFATIQAQKDKERIAGERIALLKPYETDTPFSMLADMSEEMFTSYLEGVKARHEAKIEADRKAEAERIAREKAEAEERERIRLENERLRKEKEEQDRIMAEQKAKAAAEKAELEEIARIDREQKEAEIRKANEEKERIAAELRAKEEAERKAAEAKAEAERQARLAPDKIKLTVLADRIDSFQSEFPAMATDHGKKIMDNVKILFGKIAVYIRENNSKL